MKDRKYNSHIEKNVVRTTSNGGRYVRPFDIIRSSSGRAVIKSHASASSNAKSADSVSGSAVAQSPKTDK